MGSGIRIFWDADASYRILPERLQRGEAMSASCPYPEPPPNVLAELLYEDVYVLAARPGRFAGQVCWPDRVTAATFKLPTPASPR